MEKHQQRKEQAVGHDKTHQDPQSHMGKEDHSSHADTKTFASNDVSELSGDGHAHTHTHTHTHTDGHTHGHTSDSVSELSGDRPAYTHTEGHTHTHPHTHTKSVLNRLARAIGHLTSVRTMVEQGRDCAEVLIQLAAVRSAINKTCEVILKDHLEHCIVDAVKTGNMNEIDELKRAVELLIK